MNNLDHFITWRDRVDLVMHQDIWWHGFIWGAIIGLAVGSTIGIISYSMGYFGASIMSRLIGRCDEHTS